MKITAYLFYMLSFFALFSCSGEKKEKTVEESVTTVLPDEINKVKVMRLEYSDFKHELISNGTVSATRKADLRFQTTENVALIHIKNGDRVVKGQAIASLDQFKLSNTLAQAKDNLERARLELQDVLIGQGYSIADTNKVPEAVMKIAKVKSNYDQSMIQYQLADYNLKNAVLTAPFSGIVANLFTKQYNIPDNSKPFCTIIDNNAPEVEFMVLENELPLIHPGDKVMVSTYSISDYATSGNISEINPSVDANGMVRVKASLSNAGKLYDGMNVKVRIQRTVSHQLVIPKEALVLRTNKKVVFTLKDGFAQWVYVQTGLENSTGYVLTDGLIEGDSVIYEGNINLAHESPVVVVN